MGVGAIAVTTDKCVILMQRAGWTGEAPGKVDRPGGHPEPDIALKVTPNKT
jgi:8-oxo-dGTP pyrophosphatase MutT (NUDIX family)